MGLIDFVFLSITGFIFVITLFLLMFSLKSTDDKVMRRRYKKTYLPAITLCIVALILYVAVISIGNIVI